jgi:uncharacterized membrane protein (UPF0127 family)
MQKLEGRLGAEAILAVIIASAVALSILASFYGGQGTYTGPVPSSFTVGGRTFQFTYVAVNDHQREEGLMGKKVDNSTFILFAWPTGGAYQFWMYDTNTSLDVIWVDANGTSGIVVYVIASAQPCYTASQCPRFTPDSDANFAIEAKAGFVQDYAITTGTKMSFG